MSAAWNQKGEAVGASPLIASSLSCSSFAGMTSAGTTIYRDAFRVADFRVDLRAADFFLLLVRAADLRVASLRDDVFFDVRLRGVFSPFSLASLMPIASACLRLVTLRPPRVLRVPRLRRRIALATVALAFSLYFLPDDFRPDLLAAI